MQYSLPRRSQHSWPGHSTPHSEQSSAGLVTFGLSVMDWAHLVDDGEGRTNVTVVLQCEPARDQRVEVVALLLVQPRGVSLGVVALVDDVDDQLSRALA